MREDGCGHDLHQQDGRRAPASRLEAPPHRGETARTARSTRTRRPRGPAARRRRDGERVQLLRWPRASDHRVSKVRAPAKADGGAEEGRHGGGRRRLVMRYDVFVSCGEWATVSRCMCFCDALIFFLRLCIMLNCDLSRSVTTRLNYKIRTRMYLFTLGSKSTSMHMLKTSSHSYRELLCLCGLGK